VSGVSEDHDEWQASREEANLQMVVSRRTFVAGGAGLASLAILPVLFHARTSSSLSAGQIDHEIRSEQDDATQGNQTMPLVRIEAFEGRSESEVKTLLDSAHRAIVKAFHLNERDRYQIYEARAKGHFIVEDTGLGITRTDKALIITVVSKQRPEILKRRLYREMTEELAKSASVAPSDVMICIIENGAADWTFGNGDPQFLSGELG
jgi:phenylpyruvate tautomerase PptA (4-oxalocrotonate tautomerase family)